MKKKVLSPPKRDSFLPSLKETTICFQCLNIPYIKIILSHSIQLMIQCQCGYNEIILLKDYLSKLTNFDIHQYNCKNDSKHTSTEGFAFCAECNKTLCSECKLNHSQQYKEHKVTKMNCNDYECKKGHTQCNVYYCVYCRVYFCDKEGEHNDFDEHFDHNAINLTELIAKLKEDEDTFNKREEIILNRKKELSSEGNKEELNLLTFLSLIFNTYKNNKDCINYMILTNLINNTKIRNQLTDDKYLIKPSLDIEWCKLLKEIPNPTNNVNIFALKDGRVIIYGSFFNNEPNELKIYNLDNNVCDFTIAINGSGNFAQLDNEDVILYRKNITVYKLYSKSYEVIAEITIKYDNIYEHLYKLIAVSENRFASCSASLKIWKMKDKEIIVEKSFEDAKQVLDIAEVRSSNMIVSSFTYNNQNDIVFIDSKTYKEVNRIKEMRTTYNSLIDIGSNRILVKVEQYKEYIDPLIVIDTIKFEVIKVIDLGIPDMGNRHFYHLPDENIFWFDVEMYSSYAIDTEEYKESFVYSNDWNCFQFLSGRKYIRVDFEGKIQIFAY